MVGSALLGCAGVQMRYVLEEKWSTECRYRYNDDHPHPSNGTLANVKQQRCSLNKYHDFHYLCWYDTPKTN
jgi:hypothetical protein